MPTVKDRIEEVQRDLNQLERRWTEAVRVAGSAYSEAYQHHHDNLPTKLPPDANAALLGKVIGAVAGPGAGVILSPVAAAIVANVVQQEIDTFAGSIGAYPSPGPLGTPNIDTPLKYQNEYQNFISRIFGRFEDLTGWLLDLIAGLKKASVAVNDDHVDQLIDIINKSALVPAPSGYNAWNNDKKLEIEMETAMWQAWALQLLDKDKFLLASKLDLTQPVQRMAELNLIDGRIVASGSERIAMSAEIVMIKWAKSYQPKRNIIRQAPKVSGKPSTAK